MIDHYNIAIKYLQGKYGKRCGFTSAYHEEIRKLSTAKKRREREKSITDKDYDVVIQPDLIDKATNDWVIWLLLNQYHYGIRVKQELEDNLIANGLIQ